MDSFSREIREDYDNPSDRMSAFCKKYFESMSSERTYRLTCALRELLELDSSIDDNERLYVRRNGLVFTKHEYLTAGEYNLSRLMLGLWHFIITKRPDNSVGADTYDHWFAPPEQPGAKREFISDIGLKYIEARKQFVQEIQDTYAPAPLSTNERLPERSGFDFGPYLESASMKHGEIKTLLFPEAPKPFYDVYVCNDVAKHDPYGSQEEHPEKEILRDPSVETLLSTYGRRIILYGTGGIGKSMMMRHLLLDTIKNYEHVQRVPFFVPLKDYDDTRGSLTEYIHDRIAGLCSMTLAELEASLRCGEAIVLFDGLDEIRTCYITDFERQLEIFTDRFPNATIIISSRPSRNFVSYSKYVIVEVLPFSKAQALALIDKLDFRSDEPEIKQSFREQLDKHFFKMYSDFASSPLLLTIMLMTFEQYAEIPAKMHLFYREAFYTLAQRHDASKGAYRRELKTGLTADQFSDYFAEFCARTFYAEKIDFTWYEFEHYFQSMNIVKRYPKEKVTARNFLDDLTDCLCLIYCESGQYYFTHRSFQEYFCALYFSKQKDRTLASIVPLFDNNSFWASSYVFSMLYDLIPEKVEEYILRPYLGGVLEPLEQPEGYWTYLAREHKSFTYASQNNHLILYAKTEANDFIIQFLSYSLACGIHPYKPITGHPGIDAFALSCFTDPSKCSQDELANCTVYRQEGFSVSLCNINEKSEEAGEEQPVFSMSIKIKKLLDNREDEKAKALLALLAEDDFPLKQEYDTICKFYRKLLKKEAPQGDDFFDQF